MKLKLSKKEIEEKIKKIFSDKSTPEEIKKIKRLAMSKNIKLHDFRKKFCKKCYSLFDSANSTTRIKNSKKIIRCKNCGYISRFNLK